jgi:release factor glutamine methyltransferase
MPYPTKRIYFSDAFFDVYEDVYEPAEDSFLIAESLEVKGDQAVLDLGTGCGILAVTAAKKGAKVIAVDLNPYAISCAKENSRQNNVRGRIDFLRGDLFSALSGVQFGLVLFNAPYLPSEEGEEATWIGRSWAGGANGREVVDRFISQVPAYLKPDGRVLLLQSTLTGVEETMNAFARQGLEAKTIAERSLPFFETLTLIEARPSAKRNI